MLDETGERRRWRASLVLELAHGKLGMKNAARLAKVGAHAECAWPQVVCRVFPIGEGMDRAKV
ncbi:hypothetical protein GCM10007863_28000 [Dyella mobilis]|nr:hypothetical protein GCM10007863_28000 [Dyella mobilis]